MLSLFRGGEGDMYMARIFCDHQYLHEIKFGGEEGEQKIYVTSFKDEFRKVIDENCFTF